MKKSRRYLEKLVEAAEREIEKNREFYTEGNILALEYMINEAVKALEGEGTIPFVRSRECVSSAETDPISFATKRYTMVGSYDMHEYGLETSFKWFKGTHIMNRLDETLALALERCKKICATPTDGSVGSLDPKRVEDVKQAIENTKGKQGEELGKATVKLLNAIRSARLSKKLRSDYEKNFNLFMSEDETEQFIERVESDPVLRGELDKIKGFSDTFTPEQIEATKLMMVKDIDYERVNKDFYVWRSTEKVVTFMSPEKAEYARIRFVLPPSENEESGIGHVWIDNLSVFPSEGRDWDIKNGGFEEGDELPYHWTPVAVEGEPVMRWEDKYPFCGSQKRSIYIENPTVEDSGAWVYDEDIPIDGRVNNTLFFDAKLDGKGYQGLKFEIEFLDKDKKNVGGFTHFFNKKAVAAAGQFLLTCQADAIMYMFTKERKYALKAKQQILYILNDFCQGIEHWLIFDERPEGSDAYGAVQGGRVLCSIMSAYNLIKGAEAFSLRERHKMMELLEYFLPYMLDLRDRTELSESDMQSYAGNWQTDMAAGVLFTVFAMPEMELAACWREIALKFLRSQLRVNVGADGSWPESIRYHFASLTRFAVVAKVVKNCTGEDWMKDECIGKMFRYSIYMQTPAYEMFDNRISTIPFGDHHLDSGECYAPLGIYCADIAEFDPKLGDMMYYTWEKAGKPMGHYWGEAIAFENLLGPGSSYVPSGAERPKLTSTGEFKDSGIYVFRNNYGVAGKESMFAIMAPYKKIGHGHYDEGSFVIYKDNVLVVNDPGIEGYFDSTKDWYVSSTAHGCLMFERRGGKKTNPDPFSINLEKTEYSAVRGWNDTPRTTEVTEFKTSDELDEMTVRIENIEGGTHIRNVKYYKKDDVYLIRDTVEDFDGRIRFSLPTAMKECEIDGNAVRCKGYYDVDMDVYFLGGGEPDIKVDKGRSLKNFPCEGTPMTNIIRAVADAKDGFTTLIYPKNRNAAEADLSVYGV